MALKLVIGNKNYSSWSLRPWLALTQAGIPFEEEVIPLDQPDTAERIRRVSPAGRVPVLLDGDLAVWDTLAICEYVAERFPEKRLWPEDRRARARARSVAAEMHSGFTAIRTHCPMKFKERFPASPLRDDVREDVERLTRLWNECRREFGAAGPFLFGAFSIADAFYAPVVSRFKTYALPASGEAAAWMEAVWNLPAVKRWGEAAAAERFHMKRYDTT